ncbi:hypothetical protein GCM10010429_38950 [Micromonospora olivasterospora]|uniref:ATP-binding SpoIIE family protein phosphatase n=1 Tax=Micromonospora olivasterospora TaxID=1880 RepID=UPI0031D2F725
MSSSQEGEDGARSPDGTVQAQPPAQAELPALLTAAFDAGGETGARLRAFDWSATPLGAPSDWSPALVHAVGRMLVSRAQIAMFWGPEHRAFYNDAYRPTIGGKHPHALGQPAREHWVETWDVLGPLLDSVRATGEPYRGENHPFVLDRHGFLEDVYFDVSYDPIREADGSINGIFCIVSETTGRVLGERRLRALAELGGDLAEAADGAELGRAAARTLDRYRADVPFALVYLRDAAGRLALSGRSGLVAEGAGGADPTPLGEAATAVLTRVAGGGPAATAETADLLPDVPEGVAGQALVLPVTATNEPAGALVVGISTRLPLTEEYRTFCDLVAAQLSRAVGRQRAYEQERELRGQTIRRLSALADAAVAVNTARSTAEVVQVAARHAVGLAGAARAVVTAAGARYEADGGGAATAEPAVVLPLTGTAGEQLGELRVWAGDEDDAGPGRAALAQFARLIGVRLENAQLYEAEHRIASTLQHSLLPRSLPQLPGAVVASRYLPGSADVEVGGDWYDVIRPDGELVLVIGDVVGKGVRAAAAMGQLRNALRAYVLEGYDPGEALTRLNRLVCSAEQPSFATVVCLCYTPGRLRYASAGHPSPLLIRGDEVTLLHDRALGPPVGAVPAMTYRTVEGALATGSRLLLYTDGLIEDRELGIDAALGQLRADATRPGEHVSDLVDAVVARVAARPRRDDVAVLALEATEPHRFALRLPADPTRLSVLRKRLEDFLVAHRVGATDVFDLTVAVSEAAANAIEHPVDPAEPAIGVEVTIADDEVVATVRDTGRWREPTGAGFRGRGLALIRALGELSVSRTTEGTEVTLRRRLQG